MNGNRGRFSKGGLFLIGFVTGVLVSVVACLCLANYLIKNPQKIIGKAVDAGMNRVIIKTMETVPREFVSQRETEITSAAQRFATAFSQNKIPPEKISELARMGFTIMQDQKITTQEIDEVIQTVNRISRQ